MFIDSLSIVGLISAALYLLMPILMGREFIRVDDQSDQRAPRSAQRSQQAYPGPMTTAGLVEPHSSH